MPVAGVLVLDWNHLSARRVERLLDIFRRGHPRSGTAKPKQVVGNPKRRCSEIARIGPGPSGGSGVPRWVVQARRSRLRVMMTALAKEMRASMTRSCRSVPAPPARPAPPPHPSATPAAPPAPPTLPPPATPAARPAAGRRSRRPGQAPRVEIRACPPPGPAPGAACRTRSAHPHPRLPGDWL